MEAAIYGKEMYKDGLYRVVHGPEEEANFVKKGWSEDMEPGKERSDYKVYHHVAIGSAPVEAAPVEAAPVEAAPVEAAPVKAAKVK